MSNEIHTSEQEAARHPLSPTGASRPSRAAWAALVLFCVAQFMLILDITVTNVALPRIGEDLHIATAPLGWVVAAYSLPFAALLIIGGRLGDVIGLRFAFLTGLAVFTVASLVAAVATSGGMLFPARIAQGVGAAVLSPAALGAITMLFEGPSRHRALAVWGALGAVGSAVGALLGGVLTQTVGWRWIFLVNVPVGLAVSVLLPLVLRNVSLRSRTRRADGRDPRALRDTGRAIARVLARRPVLIGSATMLVASIALIGAFLTLSITLQDALHFSPIATGLAYLPAAVGTLIGAQVGGHLLSRVAVKALAVVAFGMAALGFGIAIATASAAGIMIGMFVASIGLGAGFVIATATALSMPTTSDSGTTSGVVNTFHELGGAIGVVVASTIIAIVASVGGSAGLPFIGSGVIVLAAAVASAIWMPRHPLAGTAGGFHH
jgi:MFS family permease